MVQSDFFLLVLLALVSTTVIHGAPAVSRDIINQEMGKQTTTATDNPTSPAETLNKIMGTIANIGDPHEGETQGTPQQPGVQTPQQPGVVNPSGPQLTGPQQPGVTNPRVAPANSDSP